MRFPLREFLPVLLVVSAINARANVLYVDLNSTNSAAPYSTWSTAATNIQNAIDAATAGDLVLVTNGIYISGSTVVYGSLTNVVAINKAVTVQSVNGPGVTTIRNSLFYIFGYATRCVYMTNNSTLIGFNVNSGTTRSAGDSLKEESGGGIWCEDTSATISNCVITANSAYISGGGVVGGTLYNCLISGNVGSKIGGESTAGQGGGAFQSVLNNCTITGNSAFNGGGAAFSTLNFCTVSGNAATAPFNSGNYFLTGGGGVYNGVANNCKIVGNSAYIGGGFYGLSFSGPQAQLNNCLVASNFVAYVAGGCRGTYDGIMNNCTIVANGGGQSAGALFGALNNCIVYYNNGSNFNGSVLNNCCTFPMPTNGVGNFTNLPQFAIPSTEYHLLPNSPCIDTGSNVYVAGNFDLDGNSRLVNGTVDVGAYEYQNLPIFIITQPSNQTNTIGQSVSFKVLATGSPQVNYQWQFNQTIIGGATNATLTLSNIQLSQAGNYSVILSNSLTNLVSSNASLTLNYPPPAMLSQPNNMTIFVGSSASFSAAVLTYSPTAYQWFFNGAPLSDGGGINGSTTTNLTISGAQTNESGSYWLVATNDYGSISGSAASLSVLPVTTANIQPQNWTTNGGATVTFTATIGGQGPYSYQWQFNGTNLSGATSNTLTLTNLLDIESGNYAVSVGNAAGAIISPATSLTVVPFVNPSVFPGTVTAGSPVYASFNLTEGGFLPGTVYQWYLDGTNLGPSWAWTNPSQAVFFQPLMKDAGVYSIVATDTYTNATSSNVTLTVIPLAITTQPKSQSTVGGTNVTLTVAAQGEAPVTFQWAFDGVAIPGATNTSLALTNLTLDQSGIYTVLVTNLYTNILSSNATLTVAPLAFTTQPTNKVTWLGGSAAFKVIVTGQPPFTYDWQLQGADIGAPSTNVLNLTNIQMPQFGPYDVVVSNSYGSVTSSVASLIYSQVAVWGGSYGETNLTNNLDNILAISGGPANSLDCLALRKDGTVITWPASLAGFSMSGITNLIAIAGGSPGYGLRSDGAAVDWVYDGALPLFAMTNVAAISSKYPYFLALGKTGTIPPNPAGPGPLPYSNLVAVAAGGGHFVALSNNGTVVAWGNNNAGQTNVPPGLSNVVAIAAGASHTLALKGDGTVTGWGLNQNGQTTIPNGLSNVVAIAAGNFHSMALQADGTVVAWGLNDVGETNVPRTLTNVIAIAAGQNFSMALIGNGPPTNHVLLPQPQFSGGQVGFAVPTLSGRTYALEYKNSLFDSNWTSLPLVPGNGGAILLTNPVGTNGQRFYRCPAMVK